jgi:hypothetical protein
VNRCLVDIGNAEIDFSHADLRLPPAKLGNSCMQKPQGAYEYVCVHTQKQRHRYGDLNCCKTNSSLANMAGPQSQKYSLYSFVPSACTIRCELSRKPMACEDITTNEFRDVRKLLVQGEAANKERRRSK